MAFDSIRRAADQVLENAAHAPCLFHGSLTKNVDSKTVRGFL